MNNKDQKVRGFMDLFQGNPNAYGTYDAKTKKVRQIKQKVTRQVIYAHLIGHKPFGIYLLNNDRTHAIAVDFDTQNRLAPISFVSSAKHYNLPAYVERSKSKGYHVWIFFEGPVLARKARLVVKNILEDLEMPETEVFPKHDYLSKRIPFSNFINAPLFGKSVKEGKTVFIDPVTFAPYSDQWRFLKSVKKINESVLDDIIEINNLDLTEPKTKQGTVNYNRTHDRYALPLCAQKMLLNGVEKNQRVCCFRLSVHFRRIGLPLDLAVAALQIWALKNKPIFGKEIITDQEIYSQALSAYKKDYRSYGCGTEAVKPFCQSDCLIYNRIKGDRA